MTGWRTFLGEQTATFARRRGGWALTLMAVFLCLFTALLAAVQMDELHRTDRALTHALQAGRSSVLDALARALTTLGNFGLLVALGLLAALYLWRRRKPWAACLLLGTLIGHPLSLAIKLLANRPRPSQERDMVEVLMPTSGTSFPSGHALSAVLFFGFLAYLAWVLLPRPRLRRALAAGLAAIAVLIGLSRVYVGGHWFSDVLGGWAVGLFFLIGFAELYRRMVSEKELAPEPGEETSGAAATTA
jgi:Membrane-associated phospholipid phosphatase